ncbi:MAG: purine-nucleoside phosphorylase [Verrucomicrobia bacterium]|nr:purine-nucleoside phosphorylase [Verrucomicrobiota bacterium]
MSQPSGNHARDPHGRPSAATVAASLLRRSTLRPSLALVLGSGFDKVLGRCTSVLEISYSSLPGFPRPGVAGHAGKLVLGYVARIPVAILSGRGHFYEGHSMEAVTFPVRVLAELGVKTVCLTCAAGGINSRYKAGDYMVFSDHINFMGTNPLRGWNLPGTPRFVDLSQTYERGLRDLVEKAAKKAKARLHTGQYLAVCGPSYETPAEIRAFGRLGADAVGMSTVPEAIVARQCGLRVAALACITNLAAGRNKQAITHAEVLSTGEAGAQVLSEMMEEFVKLYAQAK